MCGELPDRVRTHVMTHRVWILIHVQSLRAQCVVLQRVHWPHVESILGSQRGVPAIVGTNPSMINPVGLDLERDYSHSWKDSATKEHRSKLRARTTILLPRPLLF
jgi:hypothetical protein